MTWYNLLAGVRILGGSAEMTKRSASSYKVPNSKYIVKSIVTNTKDKDINNGLKNYI